MNEDIKAQVMKKPPVLRLMAVIMDVDKADRITDALRHENCLHMHFQFRAEGTARSETLDMLGLGSTSKVVSLCVASQSITQQLMDGLSRRFQLVRPGAGIAFTLPLSGAASPMVKLLDDETRELIQKKLESEVERMRCESTHDIILAVINQGYSEDLMDAARSAGATGGTVFNARRVGHDGPMKFLGITIQPEKEVVAILTDREKKVEIMKAISHKCGLNTEAHGITLSLPVDSVAGLEGLEE